MSSLSPALAYAAGALTILSPCVLPLVPIVLGSAAQQHKWGSASARDRAGRVIYIGWIGRRSAGRIIGF
jgi:cytochrome c biogenesis protein CcdA